jgi:hypothetical protein
MTNEITGIWGMVTDAGPVELAYMWLGAGFACFAIATILLALGIRDRIRT